MKTLVASLTLPLMLLIADASVAQQAYCVRDPWGNCLESPRRHARLYRHCAKSFWGVCEDGGRPWRYRRRYHYRAPVAVDRGTFCHSRRRVVGEERSSKAKALRAADDAWMGAVRYDHGERYQDLNHARDVRHNCDPSSTSSILKRVHFRCVVEATPCRAPTGSIETNVKRQYDEEVDDDDRLSRK
jgi:hypothetical protein